MRRTDTNMIIGKDFVYSNWNGTIVVKSDDFCLLDMKSPRIAQKVVHHSLTRIGGIFDPTKKIIKSFLVVQSALQRRY